jgi:hypothetical protein
MPPILPTLLPQRRDMNIGALQPCSDATVSCSPELLPLPGVGPLQRARVYAPAAEHSHTERTTVNRCRRGSGWRSPRGIAVYEVTPRTRQSKSQAAADDATLGFGMCYDGSDPLALTRVFSPLLARVNDPMLTRAMLTRVSCVQLWPFAGLLEWAVQGSNLRPWD